MNYWNLLFVAITIFVLKLADSWIDKNKIHKMADEFDNFILKKSTKKPNNREFNILYKKIHGKRSLKTRYVRPVTSMQTEVSQADVLASFPSTDHQLLQTEISILENLKDAFDSRFLETFSPRYWVLLILLLPQKIIGYLGLSEDHLLSKLLNVIYWGVTFSFAFLKPIILQHISIH